MSELADALRSQLGARAPRVALILGSGLGALVDAVQEPKRVPIPRCRACRSRR